jgi:tetratricopeptide (TPR) repeat protein
VNFQNFDRLALKARTFHVEQHIPQFERLYPALFKNLDLYNISHGENYNAFVNQSTSKLFKRQKDEKEKRNETLDPMYTAIHGHFKITGITSTAIPFYEEILPTMKTDPVLNLCLGVCYLAKAFHKRQSRQNHLLTGMNYLKLYRKYRGECPEVWFNLGRAYHQIGVLHLAIKYYRMALVGEFRLVSAYNLAMVYVTSGSLDLAQLVLHKYCEI